MNSSGIESTSRSSKTSETFNPSVSTSDTAASSTNSTDFNQILTNIQTSSAARSNYLPNRWSSLKFLTTVSSPTAKWPWTYSSQNYKTNLDPVHEPEKALRPTSTTSEYRNTPIQPNSTVSLDATLKLSTSQPSTPLALSDYPRPIGDNGWGVHWIPTVSQTPADIDHFVKEAVEMGMKWVLFLNDGSNIEQNDYLVKNLVKAGIEPMLRVYTPGLVPIDGDLKEMVRHYKALGVNYFQLYNEPNLMVETGGHAPNVDHYLDLWIPAAQQVIEGGGLPGFGALSPQGEVDDRDFLRRALAALNARGQSHLLNQGWLAMHNYTGPRPLTDPDGFLRFQQYNQIIEAALNRSIPIIGTEGGTHISPHVTEQQQIDMVTGSYKYMQHREPYNFAYTYWILANGHDPAWNEHALIRPEGPTALANALKKMARSIF